MVSPTHWIVLVEPPDLPHRCSFRIEADTIEAGWNDTLEVADIGTLMTTVGLAAQRIIAGHVCLHGCAVEDSAGRVLLFLGKSGRGKSTTALAVIATGGRLISEELVVLDTADAQLVLPGAAILKVSPAGANALGYAGRSRPAFRSTGLREWVAVDLLTSAERVGTKARIDEIYLLERRHAGTAPILSPPLETANAAAHVAASAYWKPQLPIEASVRVLGAALPLARDVPVRFIALPDNLDRLQDAVATWREGVAR